MVAKLSELFAASKGKPVEWSGNVVHMMIDFGPLASNEQLSIEFGAHSLAREQALRLKANGGVLRVNGQELPDVVLWSNSAPVHVVVGVKPKRSDQGVSIRVWNAWLDPAGTMQAWIGNAGVLVESRKNGETVLRCSDGFDEPTFDDLVATIRVDASDG